MESYAKPPVGKSKGAHVVLVNGCAPQSTHIKAHENAKKAFVVTEMASLTGQIDVHASEGTEQPATYTVYSSVTLRQKFSYPIKE